MTRDNSSPDPRARVRLPHPLPALPLFFFAAFFAFAAQTQAQSNGARPVARLVATTTAAPSASAVTSSARCESRTRYAHSPSFAATSAERRAFDLVNQERAARGEARLTWDDSLAQMARDHSEEMARTNSLTHADGAGRDTFARAADEGVCGWRALGENIAYNQGFEDPVAFAVERWMQSPKHRENILRAQFTHAAVGISKAADGTVYFTQVFVTR